MAGIQIDGVNNKIDFDDDADTSISSASDDTLVVEVGGNTLATVTATSLTINDGVTITTADNTDTLTLVSTDTDASLGPHLVLHRNAGNGADNDFCGEISFPANDDAGNAFDIARFTSQIIDASNGSEDGKFYFNLTVQGGEQEIFNASGFGGGGAEFVVNDSQLDINFRVESDNNSNMLRVDAGTDCVIVGANARTGDERFLVHSAENQTSTVLNAANNSYSQDVIDINCNRSGTSSFNFVRMMSDADSGQDSEFIFAGNGSANADGTFNNNGADYAEFFETNDGNGIDVGKTVVLDGNKVRASTSSDNAATIIGVVRPKVDGINSMVIGNTAWNRWTNKYLHDDYGRFIMEDYTVTEWQDGETVSYVTERIPSDVTVPSDAKVITLQRKKLNPDFDEEKIYKPRIERDEWVIIGMLGQIQVEKGQKTGDRWIKMRDISDTVEEWLVR